MKKNPRANFKEVSEKCIPKENGKYVFTAISPRNIEAALAETVQIAIPDDYSDFLSPYEDYIPLRRFLKYKGGTFHYEGRTEGEFY